MSGTIGPVVLLQVDLQRHSEWVDTAISKPDIRDQRTEFADGLIDRLTEVKFDLLYWAGDGGMFSSPSSEKSNLDFAVRAAFVAADYFQQWRADDTERVSLGWRVSLHHEPLMYKDDNPGYWMSTQLNAFAKYERRIAVAGAVAVTDHVFEHLTKGEQSKFTVSRALKLLTGAHSRAIEHVYYVAQAGELERFADHVKQGTAWFSKLATKLGVAGTSGVGPPHAVRTEFGDAVLLFLAPEPTIGLAIDLRQSDVVSFQHIPQFAQPEINSVKSAILTKAQSRDIPDNEKVSPTRVVFPLTDMPLVQIDWVIDTWSHVRALHLVLEKRGELFQKLAPRAAAVQEDGLPVPGLLCSHVVATVNGGTHVLLMQRQIKGQEDSYHKGLWSASLEEQTRPYETIRANVQRGLSEELLGLHGAEDLDVRILAGLIESPILNLTIAALVELPYTLHELVDEWMQAIDKDEHRQIAAIPLDRDIIERIGATGELSKEVRQAIVPADLATFTNTEAWKLHPTSLFRLAMALWVRESTTTA